MSLRMSIIVRRMLRFGHYDRVYYPQRVENVVQLLDESQDRIYLHDSPDLVSHVLLVRRFGGEWRLFEVEAAKVTGGSTNRIPPVAELPLVSDTGEGDRLVELLRIGRREVARMQNAER